MSDFQPVSILLLRMSGRKIGRTKKTTLITSSTLISVSPNTMHTYTSKSPRHRREHQLSLMCASSIWRFQISKNKANASLSLCLLSVMLHRQLLKSSISLIKAKGSLPKGHHIKEKSTYKNLCKCLIPKVDQPGLEPGTSRL